MRKLFTSIFTLFLSPAGLVVLAALDSSMVFYLPAAVEAAIVILTSRQKELFWLFPILAAAGSTAGAFVTFVIGSRIGKEGLKYWVPEGKLKSVTTKIKQKGAVAMALAALLPPPFPLAPFVLACGALQVRRIQFLLAFGIARLVRFGIVAFMARLYGRWILRVMESTAVKVVAVIFGVVAVAGTAYSIYIFRRNARRHREAGVRNTRPE